MFIHVTKDIIFFNMFAQSQILMTLIVHQTDLYNTLCVKWEGFQKQLL